MLADVFRRMGYTAAINSRGASREADIGDVVVGRSDVLPTLDGVDHGIGDLARIERSGAHVVNTELALPSAHNKLVTGNRAPAHRSSPTRAPPTLTVVLEQSGAVDFSGEYGLDGAGVFTDSTR